MVGCPSGGIVELCGTVLTLAPGELLLLVLGSLPLGADADQLRGLCSREGLDRREVTAGGLGAMPPPFGLPLGAGWRVVTLHPTSDLGVLLHLPVGEALLVRARLVQSVARFGDPRVGVGLALRHHVGPRLDGLRHLRHTAPAP